MYIVNILIVILSAIGFIGILTLFIFIFIELKNCINLKVISFIGMLVLFTFLY